MVMFMQEKKKKEEWMLKNTIMLVHFIHKWVFNAMKNS